MIQSYLDADCYIIAPKEWEIQNVYITYESGLPKIFYRRSPFNKTNIGNEPFEIWSQLTKKWEACAVNISYLTKNAKDGKVHPAFPRWAITWTQPKNKTYYKLKNSRLHHFDLSRCNWTSTFPGSIDELKTKYKSVIVKVEQTDNEFSNVHCEKCRNFLKRHKK
jgi:hypothetical protein